MKDSFIFYRSFFEAIKELPKEDQSDVINAICEYALNDTDIDVKGVPKALFTLIKPQLHANKKRYENGKKGGRPITKTKPKHNLNITKQEPNKNVNVNVNVNKNNNANEIDLEEVKEIFNSLKNEFPKISKISDKRKNLIKARAKEYDLKTIGIVLNKASESNFLNGNNINGWTANFDWIFNATNFLKILEDNYINKKRKEEVKIGRQTPETIEQNYTGW